MVVLIISPARKTEVRAIVSCDQPSVFYSLELDKTKNNYRHNPIVPVTKAIHQNKTSGNGPTKKPLWNPLSTLTYMEPLWRTLIEPFWFKSSAHLLPTRRQWSCAIGSPNFVLKKQDKRRMRVAVFQRLRALFFLAESGVEVSGLRAI